MDLDDLQTDPNGPEYIKDDVRLGGAVEDVGSAAGEHGARIERLARGAVRPEDERV